MVDGIYGRIADLCQNRISRIIVLFLVYVGLLVGSLWLAYQLRFDFFVVIPFSCNLVITFSKSTCKTWLVDEICL